MSKLSLAVEKSATAYRALALAETPKAVLEVETLAAAAKRYAKSLEDGGDSQIPFPRKAA